MSQPFNGSGASPHSNGEEPHLPLNGAEARSALPSSNGRALERLGATPPVASYPSAPLGSGDDDEGTVDLSRYWRALQRRWPLALKTCLTVLALGTVWTLLQKPVYQSTATLLVSTPGGGGGGGGNNALFASLLGGSAPSSSLGQQMVIIRSPGVQVSALNRLDAPTKDQISRFARADIAPQAGADAIDVQVQARDAAAAAAYANAICNEYIARNQKQNEEQVQAATRQIGEQRKQARDDLNKASARLARFQERNNTLDIETETKNVLGRIADLENAARQNNADRVANQASLQTVEEQLRRLPDYSPNSIVPTAEVEALKAQLVKLQLERVAQSRQYKDTSRVIRDIDKQIADVNARLQRAAKTQVGGLSPNPLRQSLLQQKATLQGQIEAGESRVADLKNSLAQAQDEKEALPSRTNNLNQLKLDQQTSLAAYQSLSEKYQSLSASAQARVSTSSINTPARAGAMIAPRRMFNLIASAFLGLLLGLALALIVDRLDNRVHGSEDAEDAAHLPILAHVPRVAGGISALGSGGTLDPAFVESFRLLRANIAFAGLDEPPRVLAITSGRAGEGKTTSALNLATIVALAGKSVLLVDCDLRRPGVHAALGLANEVGLSSVVSGMSSLPAAMQTTNVPGLRVITSGPTPPNAPELLDSRRGRATFDALRDSAEFVVFDCPPTLGLADAHLIAGMADATLVVVECESTTRRDVGRTTRSLTQAGARLLGIVLNKTPVTRGDNDEYFRLPTFDGSASGLLVPTPVASPVASPSSVAYGGATPATTNERGLH